MTLNELRDMAHTTAKVNGFWGEINPDIIRQLSKIGLLTEELGEAVSAIRKPGGNLGEELADIIIRVLDFAGGYGIDIEEEVRKKMAHNTTREYRHGKLA